MATKQIPILESEISEKQKNNAKWYFNTTKILLQACMDEIRNSGKPRISFRAKRWEAVLEHFNTRANKNYAQKQLKNRMDNLKTEWTKWQQLKRKETGLGYNHETGTIIADDTQWEALIKENKRFVRFRYHGLEHHDELEFIFGDTVATSKYAWTPGMSIPNEDNDKSDNPMTLEDGLELDNEDFIVDEDFSPVANTQLKRKRMVSKDMGKMSKGKKKVGTTESMKQIISRIADAVESHNANEATEISATSTVTGQYSIPECVTVLKSLKEEGALTGEQFGWAINLIQFDKCRVTLMSLSDTNDKLDWLMYNYNLEKAKL